MRPANLIPPEERRNRGSGLRAAPLAYIVVGALLLALGGMTLLMTTNNKIADRKDEIVEARHQTKTAEVKATELTTYTNFHLTAASRTQTVTNLANSRFDWEKVMRQLALISPLDVWLIGLSGSVRSGVSVGSGESVALRTEVPGPALSINGCALSQAAVANYVTELKEIEGVTRVGLQISGRDQSGAAASSGGLCAGHGTVTFQAVAAFDAAPIPTPIIGAEAPVEAAPVEEAPVEGEASESTEATTEGE